MAAPKKSPSTRNEVKAQQIAARLRDHHRLGVLAENKKLKPGEIKLHNEYTLDKFQAFARYYTDEDLDTLCKRKRPNGLPLHWGYIPYLLAVQAKASVKYRVRMEDPRARMVRRDFQRRAVKNDWSVAELRAAIDLDFPTPPAARRGRRLSSPKDLTLGLITFLRDLDTITRRAKMLSVLATDRNRAEFAGALNGLTWSLSRAQKKLKGALEADQLA